MKAKLGEVLGKGLPLNLRDNSIEWVLPDQHVGVEVEIEGYEFGNHPHISGWEAKPDGSLRRGTEYVTMGAGIFGPYLTSALREFTRVALEKNFQTSSRTGIHVHMDVRDMNIQELKNLASVYLLFEPALYGLAGEWRKHCGYCAPYFDMSTSLEDFQRVYLLEDEKRIAQVFEDLSGSGRRYVGFNLCSVQRHGTVEFRHMETTFDLGRIVNWINVLMSLKRKALEISASDENVAQWAKRVGYEGLLSNTFGGHLANSMAQYFDVKLAKEALLGCKMLMTGKAFRPQAKGIRLSDYFEVVSGPNGPVIAPVKPLNNDKLARIREKMAQYKKAANEEPKQEETPSPVYTMSGSVSGEQISAAAAEQLRRVDGLDELRVENSRMYDAVREYETQRALQEIDSMIANTTGRRRGVVSTEPGTYWFDSEASFTVRRELGSGAIYVNADTNIEGAETTYQIIDDPLASQADVTLTPEADLPSTTEPTEGNQ